MYVGGALALLALLCLLHKNMSYDGQRQPQP
jgi:hypothetical protein